MKRLFQSIGLILLWFTMFTMFSCNKQNTVNVQENYSEEERKFLAFMDSCLVMAKDADLNERVTGRSAAADLVLGLMHDSVMHVSQEVFLDLLTKYDTILNGWYIMNLPENNAMFVHEVMCEDEWILLSLGFDGKGECVGMTVDFPENAKSDFKIAFTNVTEFDEPSMVTDGEISPFSEESLIPLVDYIQEDEYSIYAQLDSSIASKMLHNLYIYFFYVDENNEMKTSRCNLEMLQRQYGERFNLK